MPRRDPTSTNVAALIERLAANPTLSGAPPDELEWLATNGDLRTYGAGEVMVAVGQPAREMIIQFSGRIVVLVGQARGRRHPMESREGSISGLLPYSRLTSPPSDVVAVEETELLAFDRDLFPALVSACPVVTGLLVHTMIDRARRFAAVDWQDEKLMSLGRLAASLSHELNNPAAAAVSGAQHLSQALIDVGEAAHSLGTAAIGEDARREVEVLIRQCVEPARQRNPLERADDEERIAAWFQERNIEDTAATTLADAGIGTDTLDALARVITGPALVTALRWVATTAGAKAVAGDVVRSARRINNLVTAVRDFTHMDRAHVPEATDVAKGIADTITVLGAKVRAKDATVHVKISPDLPAVRAVGAELNQVWSQLLDNALDAIDLAGEVRVAAVREGEGIAVSVADNGAGIPDDIKRRVFDPFFTTKAVGSATGLGLHLAQRIVHAHHGEIDFSSRPGHTEFCVRLQLAADS